MDREVVLTCYVLGSALTLALFGWCLCRLLQLREMIREVGLDLMRLSQGVAANYAMKDSLMDLRKEIDKSLATKTEALQLVRELRAKFDDELVERDRAILGVAGRMTEQEKQTTFLFSSGDGHAKRIRTLEDGLAKLTENCKSSFANVQSDMEKLSLQVGALEEVVGELDTEVFGCEECSHLNAEILDIRTELNGHTHAKRGGKK